MRLLSIFTLLFLWPALLPAAPAPDPSLWGANGSVDALVIDESGVNGVSRRYYLGGQFDFVGPAIGSAAIVAADPAQPASDLPAQVLTGIDGRVLAVIADGAGGWFIAGDFSLAAGQPQKNLLHVLADGRVDGNWTATTDGPVYALSRLGGQLFVGGGFTRVNGLSYQNLAALNVSDGVLQTAWRADANGVVRALLAAGGRLHVGGDFTTIAGQSRAYLAALNASDGSPLAWLADSDGPVRALSLSATLLYVGGDFATLAGQPRAFLAAVDPVTAALSTWSPAADAAIHSLLLDPAGSLYVGGDFSQLGGLPRAHLAALDPLTGAVSGWDPTVSGPVYSLALAAPSTLYVGGDFRLLGGIQRRNLAAVSTTLPALPSSWNPGAGAAVRSLFWQANELLVAGDFKIVGGESRENLAVIDAATGQLLTPAIAANGRVRSLALAADGRTLYLGGDFSGVAGRAHQHVAAVDTQTGLSLDWAVGADARVDSVVLAENEVTLFIAGEFANVAGQPRSGLAQIRTTTGTATAWRPAVNAPVRSLLRRGATLYLGGAFDAALGQSRPRLAAVDLETLALLEWRPQVDNGEVLALTTSAAGDIVVAGGTFTQVASVAQDFLAAFDSAQASRLVNWRPQPDGPVRAIERSFDGTRLYIGGDFRQIAGLARPYIASVALADGTASSDWSVTVDAPVRAMAQTAAGDRLLLGGDFSVASNEVHARLSSYPTAPPETLPPQTIITPAPGSYNRDTVAPLVLTCDDGNGSGCAATYFSIDGRTPLATAEFLYAAPITLEQDMTVRYFSVDRMGNREGEQQAAYLTDFKPPTTRAEPATRVFFGATLTVQLICSDEGSGCGATYYTLDGSPPTRQSPRYQGPLTISSNVDLKFFSVDLFDNGEDFLQESYVRNPNRLGALQPWWLSGMLCLLFWRHRRRSPA